LGHVKDLMTMDILTRPFVLITICALGYAVATLAMKAASSHPGLAAYGIIAACLAAAVLAEVVLLQRAHLGLAYVAILGAETVIILVVAAMLGEGLGPRDLAGAALVLIGAGVISA
jgi:multidrug transporter EmrE-like cation transporter